MTGLGPSLKIGTVPGVFNRGQLANDCTGMFKRRAPVPGGSLEWKQERGPERHLNRIHCPGPLTLPSRSTFCTGLATESARPRVKQKCSAPCAKSRKEVPVKGLKC